MDSPSRSPRSSRRWNASPVSKGRTAPRNARAWRRALIDSPLPEEGEGARRFWRPLATISSSPRRPLQWGAGLHGLGHDLANNGARRRAAARTRSRRRSAGGRRRATFWEQPATALGGAPGRPYDSFEGSFTSGGSSQANLLGLAERAPARGRATTASTSGSRASRRCLRRRSTPRRRSTTSSTAPQHPRTRPQGAAPRAGRRGAAAGPRGAGEADRRGRPRRGDARRGRRVRGRREHGCRRAGRRHARDRARARRVAARGRGVRGIRRPRPARRPALRRPRRRSTPSPWILTSGWRRPSAAARPSCATAGASPHALALEPTGRRRGVGPTDGRRCSTRPSTRGGRATSTTRSTTSRRRAASPISALAERDRREGDARARRPPPRLRTPRGRARARAHGARAHGRAGPLDLLLPRAAGELVADEAALEVLNEKVLLLVRKKGRAECRRTRACDGRLLAPPLLHHRFPARASRTRTRRWTKYSEDEGTRRDRLICSGRMRRRAGKAGAGDAASSRCRTSCSEERAEARTPGRRTSIRPSPSRSAAVERGGLAVHVPRNVRRTRVDRTLPAPDPRAGRDEPRRNSCRGSRP